MSALRIVPPGPQRQGYLPLLMLADDSEKEVQAYYQTGDLYVFDEEDTPVGITLAIAAADGAVELKSVAVETGRHNQGFGQRMLTAVLADLKARDVHRVIVGTASSGVGVLAFYQKVGFRLLAIERDFFSPARGYPEGLSENGIPVRDMVWMDRQL